MKDEPVPLLDALSIREQYARLGYLIDEGRWDRLSEVLADDIVTDATAVGFGTMTGLAQVQRVWSSRLQEAKSHHATNVVLYPIDDERVRAIAKGISTYGPCDVRTVTWFDTVVRTRAGWRIARRATVRTAASVDAEQAREELADTKLGGPTAAARTEER